MMRRITRSAHSAQPARTIRFAFFRRTRAEVGQDRGVESICCAVRLSGPEMEMHRLLGDYTRRVWQMRQVPRRGRFAACSHRAGETRVVQRRIPRPFRPSVALIRLTGVPAR